MAQLHRIIQPACPANGHVCATAIAWLVGLVGRSEWDAGADAQAKPQVAETGREKKNANANATNLIYSYGASVLKASAPCERRFLAFGVNLRVTRETLMRRIACIMSLLAFFSAAAVNHASAKDVWDCKSEAASCRARCHVGNWSGLNTSLCEGICSGSFRQCVDQLSRKR
jgi:hypothetical protein